MPVENERTSFHTQHEPHPSQLVDTEHIQQAVGIQELRHAIPEYCFKPSLRWSFFYLVRDLTYAAALLIAQRHLVVLPAVRNSAVLYHAVNGVYGFCQGIVWTGLWVIAHDAGHSGFSRSPTLNDLVGFTIHSALLAPYFSWKSTHRRHHIYANHIDKDLNYVPPQRHEYARRIGVAVEQLDHMGQDTPVVLFLRIVLQQVVGWNWYILSNITCPNTAVVKKSLTAWRYSHFDPWGGLFRANESFAVILSDLGCLATLAALFICCRHGGSCATVFWVYVVPWSWVNHWIVMITFLHHTHPSVPKYSQDSWTFVRGATATIDRDFGWIGSHFFHHISSDHVTHHLFPSIPHYWSPIATRYIAPVLGTQYHGRGTFTYTDLKTSFAECQWVQPDTKRDRTIGLSADDAKQQALWFQSGSSPPPEYRQRRTTRG